MPYIPPDQIAQAKQIDLLTYLQAYEPDELVHVAGQEYSTKTHDSLKISHGMWCWNSRGIGGKSALDFLIKVRGMTFLEAAEHILRVAPQTSITARAGGSFEPPVFSCPEHPRKLILPAAAPNNDRAIAYLAGRGIHPKVLAHCIQTGLLYESADYHNCVFVGMDRAGTPRYAALRGTSGSFKGEARGSDKRYAFSLPSHADTEKLHVFESAIDLLSYVTLRKSLHQLPHLLSLAGVFTPTKNSHGRLPAALACYLKDFPAIQEIDLHLDNDHAGREATRSIFALTDGQLSLRNRSPPHCKDVNEALCLRLGISPKKNNLRSADFVV